jgi:hypothetical protein
MNPADDARDSRCRLGAILGLVVTPWRAGRIVARPPLRIRYFVLVGLLWFPALWGGGSLGHALHQRFELPAPQANLMGTVATGVVASAPTWRIALGVAVWLAGSIACGAVLVELGGALLGALLRDRQLGGRLGAVAILFAPIFALASGVALTADVVWVHGRRDWLAVAVVGVLALWPVAGWGALARAAARHVARPRLPPAGCAAGFAVGFAIAVVVVQRLASEALALVPGLVRWLAA